MERANDALLLIGRLLLATLFLPSGIGKLLEFQTFAARPTLQALPFGGTVWAAAAVTIEVLVPIALILGFAPRLSALLLIAFRDRRKRHHASLLGTCRADAARAGNQLFQKHWHSGRLCFYMVSGPGAWSISGDVR